MRWLTVAGVLLYLTRCNDAGALKCHPGSQDPLCALEKKEISPIQNLIERNIESADDAQCEPGSEWESNCHRCHCSDSGFSQCTKLYSCIAEKLADPISCRPNTMFNVAGSTCLCLENGLGLCTLQSHTIEKRSPEEQCTPGSMFKISCNTCTCLADGSASCTKRGCLDRPISVKQKREIPNANVTSRSIRSASPETPKACQPGQEFRRDCNKCLCNDEGHDFSCTRIDCTALNNGGTASFASTRRKRDTTEKTEEKCVPGSVFDRSCNVCRCSADGLHATCTLKRCQKADATAVTTDASPAFRCTPGDQFRRDCNDCTCSADGKMEFCTLRLCDDVPDLAP